MKERVLKVIEKWEREAEEIKRRASDPEDDIIDRRDHFMMDEAMKYIRTLPEEVILKNSHFELIWVTACHLKNSVAKIHLDRGFNNEFGNTMKEINRRAREEIK